MPGGKLEEGGVRWVAGILASGLVMMAVAVVMAHGLTGQIGGGGLADAASEKVDCSSPEYPATNAPPGSPEWVDAVTKPAPGPEIEPVSPKNEEVVTTPRPVIRVKWNNWRKRTLDKVILRLNGKEVGGPVVRKDCLFTYVPEEDLPHGDVWVHIIVLDTSSGFSEATWVFGVYTKAPQVVRTFWGTTESGEYDRRKLVVQLSETIPPALRPPPSQWTVRNRKTGKAIHPVAVSALSDRIYALTFREPFPGDMAPDVYEVSLAMIPAKEARPQKSFRAKQQEESQWPSFP